jgi:hypothetical protein
VQRWRGRSWATLAKAPIPSDFPCPQIGGIMGHEHQVRAPMSLHPETKQILIGSSLMLIFALALVLYQNLNAH